jgi:hypothetical protein
LTCLFSQLVSNKIARNVILNIVSSRKIVGVLAFPLPDLNIHIVAAEDFQRNAIYRQEFLETHPEPSGGHQSFLQTPASGSKFWKKRPIAALHG